jgi:hypothetical protein
MLNLKRGVILVIDNRNGQQIVKTTDGETHILGGFDRVKDGRVGDRVVLEYRTHGSMSLWFGRKEV